MSEVTEVIYGRNPVRAALQAGRSLNRIYIAEGVARKDVADILDLARKRGVVFQFTERRRLDRLTDGSHQGVVATVAGHPYAEMADILASARRGPNLPPSSSCWTAYRIPTTWAPSFAPRTRSTSTAS